MDHNYLLDLVNSRLADYEKMLVDSKLISKQDPERALSIRHWTKLIKQHTKIKEKIQAEMVALRLGAEA
jgi:hypothetical protein